MTRDEFIYGWFRFQCGVSWEARRAWEYVELYGDPFNYFNLPALSIPKCKLRCRRCKTELDIDFAVIRGAEVYDYDCEKCYCCNCFSSIAAIKKLDAFRRRCERYDTEWQRIVYSYDDYDDEFETNTTTKKRRTGIPLRIRWRVLKRDNFRCRYCGGSGDDAELHVDHAVSRADGGTNEIQNLVTACIPCNLGKGADSVLPERQN